MKKSLLVLALLIILGGLQVKAVKPIPTYNLPLQNVANFQEKHNNKDNDNGVKLGVKYKRDLDVRTTVTPPGHKPIIFVWVYSLDMRDILGPFIMVGDDFLTVEIDEREWGVITMCSEKVYVSVWIEAEAQLEPGQNLWFDFQYKENKNRTDFTCILFEDNTIANRNRNLTFINKS
ncbi:MAG: hypothetical protein NTX61_00745 [Bacteroidetes bacterium]|nr:hypothetical protein [Bacteroidota bacterium]